MESLILQMSGWEPGTAQTGQVYIRQQFLNCVMQALQQIKKANISVRLNFLILRIQ